MLKTFIPFVKVVYKYILISTDKEHVQTNLPVCFQIMNSSILVIFTEFRFYLDLLEWFKY